MKPLRSGRNKSISDFLFFFWSVLFTSSFFISFITIKNDCIFLSNEIAHLENILANHESRVKVLSGEKNNFILQNHIEKIAAEKFGFHIPPPESLIVVVED